MCQGYSYKRSYRLFAHLCSEMLTANNKSWQLMVAIHIDTHCILGNRNFVEFHLTFRDCLYF